MYRDNDKISVMQLIAILIVALFDVQLLSFPRDLAVAVGPDGWFVLLLVLAIGAGLGWCFLKMGQMFPGEGIVEILQAVVGKTLGWVLGAGLFLLWLGQTARVVRLSSALVQVSLLDSTPNEVISLVFLLVSVHMARKGIEPMGRMATLVALGAISIASLLPLLTWPEADWLSLRPILHGGILPELKEALLITGRLSAVLVPLLLLSSTESTAREHRYIVPSALIFVGMPVFVLSLITLAVFGVQQSQVLILPGLEVVTSIEMPTLLVERLTVFYVGAWALIVFMSLSILLYLLAMIFGQLFHVTSYIPLVGFLVPPVYLISRIPPNDVAVYAFADWLSLATGIYLALILGVFFLAILNGNRPRWKGDEEV